MHDAVAGAVCGPNVSVLIDSRARRISWLAAGRSEVLADDLSGRRVDLDDRALRRHGDPDEVEFTRRVIQLQLVGDVVNDVERVALIEVGVERVSAFGERLRFDDDRHLIARAEFSI